MCTCRYMYASESIYINIIMDIKQFRRIVLLLECGMTLIKKCICKRTEHLMYVFKFIFIYAVCVEMYMYIYT